MNVYVRELRAGLKSLILWVFGMLLFIAASMQKFAVLSTDPSSLKMLDQLPLALRNMFGVGALDFSTVGGFYGMIFPFLLLMGAIHSSMLGAVIVSKEERDKTGEFLYAKPASRAALLTAKFAAALTAVVALNLVTWGCSVGLIAQYGGSEDMNGLLMTMMAGLFILQILFLALGVSAAAVSSHPKSATGVATGAMLGTYLLSVAIDVSGKFEFLKPLSPFEYFDAKAIVGQGTGLNPGYVSLALALTAAFSALAYVRFARRDLKI